MATVKRHWKAITVAALLILSICGVIAFPLLRSDQASAQSVGENRPPAGQAMVGTDPVTYSRLHGIRDQLALTDTDLASVGCDSEMARAVLTALLAWHAANVTVLSAADVDVAQKLQALQSIRGGKTVDSTVLHAASSDYYVAVKVRQKLWQSVWDTVSEHLTRDVQAKLQAARANVGVEAPYKYVADLTKAQKKALRKSLYVERRKAAIGLRADIHGAADTVLTYGQRSQVKTIAEASKLQLSAIHEVSDEVLPIPDALRPEEICADAEEMPAL